jgi:hypothetical protein
LNQKSLDELALLANRSVVLNCTGESLALQVAFTFESIPSSGFSGTSIYRLTNSIGSFAVRSWPTSAPSRDKIDFWQAIHSASQRSVARGELDCQPFPSLMRWVSSSPTSRWILPFGDHLWTLCEWVSGRPIERADVDVDLIRHAASVLGSIHRTTLSAVDEQGIKLPERRQPSASIQERKRFMQSLDNHMIEHVRDSGFFAEAKLTERVTECLRMLARLIAFREPFMEICSVRERTCHWIIRDLWHANLLVDSSGKFSSIVDLGAARLDWPGLDFIRLFGSLIGLRAGRLEGRSNDEDWWQIAFTAYAEVHPTHAIDSLDECRFLSQLSCGLSISQWVRWLTENRFEIQNPDVCKRIADRIHELCDQFVTESEALS